jgi:tetratricopeptide (TPR) repeat protein
MLGVAYAGMERHDEALKHFTKATELDPDSALAHSNLAITMLRLQRYQPAEQEARRALKLGGSLPQMEFALGVSLGAQGKQLDEAVQHLDRAGSDIPRAKIAAVKLLAAAGRRDDALHRIEQYLRNSGNTQERNDLESLRSSLNK